MLEQLVLTMQVLHFVSCLNSRSLEIERGVSLYLGLLESHSGSSVILFNYLGCALGLPLEWLENYCK